MGIRERHRYMGIKGECEEKWIYARKAKTTVDYKRNGNENKALC